MRWMLGSLVGLSVLMVGACQQAPAHKAAGMRPATAAVRSLEADFYPVTPGSKWEYQLHQRQANGDTQIRPMAIAIDSPKTRADGVLQPGEARTYRTRVAIIGADEAAALRR